MNINELISRKKSEIAAITLRYNSNADELGDLRAQEAPSMDRISELRSEQADFTVKLEALNRDLAELEREQAADDEIVRKQAESYPTDAGRGLERSQATGWIRRDNGERADVARGESVRSHPAFARSVRPEADAHALAQYGGIGQMVRALSTSGGSAVVPTLWAGEIIDKAREEAAVFRAGATLVPMDAKTVKIGRVTGDPTAAFRLENGQITASDPVLDNVTLDSKTMSTLVVGSIEWFQDADNADDIVSTVIAKALAEHLDLVSLYGGITAGAGGINLDTADGNPTGVLKSLLSVSGAPNVLGATAGVTATNGTSITAATAWDQVIDTIYKVKNANEEPTALLWSPRLAQKFAKLYDSTYQPLRQPEVVAALQKVETTKLPSYTQGSLATATDVFVGDWTKLLIGQRLDITIQVLTERYAEFGQIGIVAHWRGDVALARTSAFAAYKALQGA